MIAVDHEIATARALVEGANDNPWVVLTSRFHRVSLRTVVL